MMDSCIDWLTQTKRCRCKKCNTFQLVKGYKIFEKTARCVKCYELLDESCFVERNGD